MINNTMKANNFSPKPLEKMSAEEVRTWLASINMSIYTEKFASEEINGKRLKSMSPEQLKATLNIENEVHVLKIMKGKARNAKGCEEMHNINKGENLNQTTYEGNWVQDGDALKHAQGPQNQAADNQQTNDDVIRPRYHQIYQEQRAQNYAQQQNQAGYEEGYNYGYEYQAYNYIPPNNYYYTNQGYFGGNGEYYQDMNKVNEEQLKEDEIDGRVLKLIRCDDECYDEEEKLIGELGGIIGKGVECRLVVNDESVEGQHAEISFLDDDFYLEDIGSQSGTFVSIAKKSVQIDDIFKIGSYEFKITNVNISDNYVRYMDKVLFDDDKVEKLRKKDFYLEDLLEAEDVEDKHSFIEFEIYKHGEKIKEAILFENDYIGSNISSTLSFPDDQNMSRIHCKVIWDEYSLCLVDNNSENGVWFRLSSPGVRSSPYMIEQDQMLQIGDNRIYRFEFLE